MRRLATWSQRRIARQLPLCQKALARKAGGGVLGIDWRPNTGPQELAFHSEADEIYYGGAAGGGKTDLGLGKAIKKHRRSVFFRREHTQVRDAVDRSREIINQFGTFNGQLSRWRFPGGRSLTFGGLPHLKDLSKWFGRPFDLMIFDEAPTFAEQMVVTLAAWNRSTVPGQKCQMLLLGNPPLTEEGYWIVLRYAPWLDPEHPNPARPGELRWFARIPQDDGQEVDSEVPGPEPVEVKGRTFIPRSRTFIPAFLSDNPQLAGTDYARNLDSLPEPLRSQLKDGDFTVGRQDNAWQVIPTSWIKAAQARWKPDGASTHHLDAIGGDIARGGKDQTVVVHRRGTWFGLPSMHPGSDTPDGMVAAALLAGGWEKPATIYVDVIGVGTSVVDILSSQGLPVVPVNAAAQSLATDRSGLISFKNKRAELWWRMRELLDPVHGANIALPPGDKVIGDLSAPRWKLTPQGIQIEAKDDIIKRIGRSTDVGDAICMAACSGGGTGTDESAYKVLFPDNLPADYSQLGP